MRNFKNGGERRTHDVGGVKARAETEHLRECVAKNDRRLKGRPREEVGERSDDGGESEREAGELLLLLLVRSGSRDLEEKRRDPFKRVDEIQRNLAH